MISNHPKDPDLDPDPGPDPGPDPDSPTPQPSPSPTQNTSSTTTTTTTTTANNNNNAATGASAAGVRAISAQLLSYYFRAPAKAFFRTRVDYLAYARTLHHHDHHDHHHHRGPRPPMSARALLWRWARHTSAPGVLASAVRQQGWSVVPRQVLPPLLANVGVGAVLYTSYLHTLGRLEQQRRRRRRGDDDGGGGTRPPPPSPANTFIAGFVAGSLQSVAAAPLDALQARSDTATANTTNNSDRDSSKRPRSMWTSGSAKLRDIGLRGVFAGWTLSLAKDSLGSAVFFAVFEYVKAQGYHGFATWYYHDRNAAATANTATANTVLVRPHYALEPLFLLLAGVAASLAQQLVLHPLARLQALHRGRLPSLDAEARRRRCPTTATTATTTKNTPQFRMIRAYYRAYRQTFAEAAAEASTSSKSITRWLYRGFWSAAVRQVPGTSAGLVIFELLRRGHGLASPSVSGDGEGEVRVCRDGYDVLLK